MPLSLPCLDDPSTVEDANAHPGIMPRKTIGAADYFHEVIGGPTRKSALSGHSFGGLT